MLLCLIFEAKSLYVVFMISDEKVFLAQNFFTSLGNGQKDGDLSIA